MKTITMNENNNEYNENNNNTMKTITIQWKQ